MASNDDSAASLSQLFAQGLEVQREIENGQMNSSSREYQERVKKGVGLLEDSTRIVNRLDLFSSNEELDEVATANLKYLLLPALLGDLTLQLMGEERVDVLRRARVYVADYLQRCKSYSITSEEVPTATQPVATTGQQSFEQMTATRQAKIARQQALKETNNKLKELDRRLSSGLPVDEDVQREQTLLLLQSWVYKCLDHVISIDKEMEILSHMEQMKKSGVPPRPEPVADKLPFKPILITREMIKSKVFGAGYPSLPTVSLEEFHEQEAARIQQELERQKAAAQSSGCHGDDDHQSSDEDDEKLQRARAFDEFKDEHRRGEGNKKGKG
ncbi:immunoglobulin-binding protein 1-like [Dysidea avara]|uniref:immunoglobulin-binding protein 1-like n=1 Tax=Dysidea avara TaxID=196820 RepID=UPI003329202E